MQPLREADLAQDSSVMSSTTTKTSSTASIVEAETVVQVAVAAEVDKGTQLHNCANLMG